MHNNAAYERAEAEAGRLKDAAGGIDGWLDLVVVQDESGATRVRVLPGSMFMFEAPAENMAAAILAELRRRVDQLEAAISR